ncbi:MAG: cytochrome c [Proteobacteria bacterium]|jgi:cytochrome c556|nr:cytochrome c [Pseudomonadota bacterium]
MKKLIVGAALGSMLIAGTANAQQRDPVQSAIKYRQAVYTLVGAHFGPIGAMMRGNVDFNIDEVRANAASLAGVVPLALNAFKIESLADNSDALPGIWQNQADFDEKMSALQMAVPAFAEAAASASGADDLREAFGAVGSACRGCHEEYRADDD